MAHGELVYRDGHYHRPSADRPATRHNQHRPQHGLLQKTHDAWERVLYGVGSVYYKIRGR
jgi:hypothetical protein